MTAGSPVSDHWPQYQMLSRCHVWSDTWYAATAATGWRIPHISCKHGHYICSLHQITVRALSSSQDQYQLSLTARLIFCIYVLVQYMSQMLYAGQSAREIVTFFSDF